MKSLVLLPTEHATEIRPLVHFILFLHQPVIVPSQTLRSSLESRDLLLSFLGLSLGPLESSLEVPQLLSVSSSIEVVSRSSSNFCPLDSSGSGHLKAGIGRHQRHQLLDNEQQEQSKPEDRNTSGQRQTRTALSHPAM